MGLDGMEIFAIAAVVGLFIVVLKQFGMWEPLSLEGRIKPNIFFLLLLLCEAHELIKLASLFLKVYLFVFRFTVKLSMLFHCTLCIIYV